MFDLFFENDGDLSVNVVKEKYVRDVIKIDVVVNVKWLYVRWIF